MPGADPERVAQARGLARGMEILWGASETQIAQRVTEIEIAFSGLPESLVDRADSLRWVQLSAAGAEHALETYPQTVALTTASGVHAVPITEHVLGMMLSFARGLHRAVRAQVRGVWEPQPADRIGELRDACLVVVGLGAIGAELAGRARALGMRVLGVRRRADLGTPEGVERVVSHEDLADLLPQADYVVLTIPYTRRTAGMFGAAELGRMKPTACLINIGRGRTVREADLVQALREGRLGGAGLDVFEEEPLPPESPLWSLENVILTAHYSGVTPRYGERLWAIFLDNLDRYLGGRPLTNHVDRAEGY